MQTKAVKCLSLALRQSSRDGWQHMSAGMGPKHLSVENNQTSHIIWDFLHFIRQDFSAALCWRVWRAPLQFANCVYWFQVRQQTWPVQFHFFVEFDCVFWIIFIMEDDSSPDFLQHHLVQHKLLLYKLKPSGLLCQPKDSPRFHQASFCCWVSSHTLLINRCSLGIVFLKITNAKTCRLDQRNIRWKKLNCVTERPFPNEWRPLFTLHNLPS